MTAVAIDYGLAFMAQLENEVKKERATYSRGPVSGKVLKRLEVFAARVEHELQRREWSQNEFAKRCGKNVSQKTVNNLINIRTTRMAPRIDILMTIADVLNISLIETVMDEDEVENADMIDAIINHFSDFSESSQQYIRDVIMREYNTLKPKKRRSRRS